MAEEGAEEPARPGAVQVADGGAGEGAAGVFEGDEAVAVGDFAEEKAAPFALECKGVFLQIVGSGGAFFPAPVPGGPGDQSASGSQAEELGNVGEGAGPGMAVVELEPSVAVEGFAGLLFPWLRFGFVTVIFRVFG